MVSEYYCLIPLLRSKIDYTRFFRVFVCVFLFCSVSCQSFMIQWKKRIGGQKNALPTLVTCLFHVLRFPFVRCRRCDVSQSRFIFSLTSKSQAMFCKHDGLIGFYIFYVVKVSFISSFFLFSFRIKIIFFACGEQVLQNDFDLLNPPAELEKRKHKLKRLVQSPNSFFMVLNSSFYSVISFSCFFSALY